MEGKTPLRGKTEDGMKRRNWLKESSSRGRWRTNKGREVLVLVRSRDPASSETQKKWKKRRTERILVSSEILRNKAEAKHLLCGVKSSDRVGGVQASRTASAFPKEA